MQASRHQIISISGSEKIILSKNDIQKMKKQSFENVKNDDEIESQKIFENLFLTKTKFNHVELKIQSTDVPIISSEFFKPFSELIYNIDSYEHDLARHACRAN